MRTCKCCIRAQVRERTHARTYSVGGLGEGGGGTGRGREGLPATCTAFLTGSCTGSNGGPKAVSSTHFQSARSPRLSATICSSVELQRAWIRMRSAARLALTEH